MVVFLGVAGYSCVVRGLIVCNDGLSMQRRCVSSPHHVSLLQGYHYHQLSFIELEGKYFTKLFLNPFSAMGNF